MKSTLISLNKLGFKKEAGHCYRCALPKGLPTSVYNLAPTSQVRLFENGIELGPANAEHEHIRKCGLGAFSLWKSQLYFSSSDNGSPLRIGRRYQLIVPLESPDLSRRIDVARKMSKAILVPLHNSLINNDIGNCFTATLPEEIRKADDPSSGSQIELFEDGIQLGPGDVDHDEIRRQGGGLFSHYSNQLFFSTRDNSSPVDNGREYAVLVGSSMLRSDEPVPPFSLISHESHVAKRIANAKRERCSVLIPIRNRSVVTDRGHCFGYRLPSELLPDDSEFLAYGTGARLFEDGVELGPRVFGHDEIRACGGGRFSHSANELFFSSRDNSSPAKNSRRYEVLIPSRIVSSERHSVAPWLDGIDFDELPVIKKLALARMLYKSVWPDIVFPDMFRKIDYDQQFIADLSRVSPDADYSAERKFNLNQLFKVVSHLDGDIAECGVYKGGSAFFLARQIRDQKLNKRLYLFDSFGGLSTPSPVDGDYWSAEVLASSPEDVKQTLSNLGKIDFVRIMEGWIPTRFDEVRQNKFCLVHIDVDLYQPTRDSIEFFYPRMATGGIIWLDDYGFTNCPGVTGAVDEFMNDKSEPVVNLSSGGAFIMKTGRTTVEGDQMRDDRPR